MLSIINSSGSNPLVSVLLPVYNGEKDISAVISGILCQTLSDLELIIVDDGSTDETGAIVRGFSDPRIHYMRQENQGVARAFSNAVSYAHGLYLARQDHDDLSHPERLLRQVEYLKFHPTVGCVGTWANICTDHGLSKRKLMHPTANEELQFAALFDNPFVSSSVMFTSQAVKEFDGHTTDVMYQPADDFEFWSRIAQKFEVANIPDFLLTYREREKSISRSSRNPFAEKSRLICIKNVASLLHISPANPILSMLGVAIHPLDYTETDMLSDNVPINDVLEVIDESVKAIAAKHQFHPKRIKHMAKVLKYKVICNYPLSIAKKIRYRMACKIMSI